jgi:cytochrome c peroxidase
MRIIKIVILSLLVVGLIASMSFAAGDGSKGKALFNDPKLGTNGSTCNTCHPDGKGLEKAGLPGRKEWKNPGGTWLSIEDTNNVCIMMALKGMTIDPRSQQMIDLTTYIKSLAKKK